MVDDWLVRATNAIETAQTAEDLVRPLLDLLRELTGLDAAYMTQIDWSAGVQHVRYALATPQLPIGEGLGVPWPETVCKRAMEEKSPFVDDVLARWPDLQAAQALGIRTYASAPINLADGSVYGTLCAAGSQIRPVPPRVRQLFRFFASLIGKYVEREQLLLQLRRVNVELKGHALTDPLTRLPNRRATMDELQRLFAQARRLRQTVLLAFIDLDGFKNVNDTHGHDIGDAFLVEIGRRLSSGLRAGDWLGRLGGDEFVVVGLGPVIGSDGTHAIAALRGRLGPLTQGRFELPGVRLDYPGTSLGIVSVDPAVTTEEEALRVADAAMYLDKRERRRLQQARRA